MGIGFGYNNGSWLGLVVSEFTIHRSIPSPHYTTKTSEIAFNEDITFIVFLSTYSSGPSITLH